MIGEIDDGQIKAATDLFCQLFRREAFVGDRELIRTNINALPLRGSRDDVGISPSLEPGSGQLAPCNSSGRSVAAREQPPST